MRAARIPFTPGDSRGDLDALESLVIEPDTGGGTLDLEPLQGPRPGVGVALDRERLIEPGARGGKGGDGWGRRLSRAGRELIAGHVLKRNLPSSTLVLEGLDLDLEHALGRVEAGHLDRRAAVIEQAAHIPGHKEAQVARLEVRVGQALRVELIDRRGHETVSPNGEGGIRTLERGCPRYAISSRARSTAPAPLQALTDACWRRYRRSKPIGGRCREGYDTCARSVGRLPACSSLPTKHSSRRSG